MTTHGKCLLGTLLRDRAAEVFIWACFHRQPLLSMHQNFVVQEPKQVFSINHSLYKQVRRREPLLLTLGMVGTLLKSRFPDAGHGPTLQAGLSDDGSLRSAVLTLFGTARNQFIFWRLLSKGKDSSIYLAFPMWTTPQGNKAYGLYLDLDANKLLKNYDNREISTLYIWIILRNEC